jgi:hypothetical protein
MSTGRHQRQVARGQELGVEPERERPCASAAGRSLGGDPDQRALRLEPPAALVGSSGGGAAAAAAASPRLTKSTVSGPTGLNNGEFSWGARWAIAGGGTTTNGWIVQHVWSNST